MEEEEAFAAVATALPTARPVMAALREGVAAVLVADRDVERLIILDRGSGWRVPALTSGRRGPTVARPDQLGAAEPLRAMWLHQSSPGEASAKPAEGWLAITGLAAPQAESLVVQTAIDRHESAVRDDGRVLAVVRCAWGVLPLAHITGGQGETLPLHL